MSFNVLDFVSALGAEAFDDAFMKPAQPDPVRYAREKLGIKYIWSKQEDILQALLEPPYKVGVQAGHSVGKTFISAVAANFWYDTFDPSAVISTAPTERDVVDLLWTEIRLQRGRAGLGGLLPKAPEMRSSEEHYAKGYTARKGESFQGRHRERMLFLFDEAVGVDPGYWTTTKTMFKPEAGHAWMVIFNPTDTTSPCYQEVQEKNGWRIFQLSSMDHPNIAAGLAGEPLPVPHAVSVSQMDMWVADWCTPILESERTATDIQWRDPENPLVLRWYRPGPSFEARCLGLWPSLGTFGVWSDALFRAASEAADYMAAARRVNVPLDAIPELGCDVARHGDDFTCIHVRWGNTSFHHELWNGWSLMTTAGRLIELTREYADRCNEIRAKLKMAPIDERDVPIKIDDDGVGGGVTDRLLEQEYKAVPIHGQGKPKMTTRYPKRRDELWFHTQERATRGGVWLGRLDRKTIGRIKEELMAPKWKLDSAGRRQVEPKEDTKLKLGRSPDSADAMNLAYLDQWVWEAPTVLEQEETKPFTMGKGRNKGRAAARGLFGRK